MKLDKDKKYTFAGDVYERHDECTWKWQSPNLVHVWSDEEFQHFADRGLVEEVREPLRFEGRAKFDHTGWCTGMSFDELNRALAINKTFKITAEEIIE